MFADIRYEHLHETHNLNVLIQLQVSRDFSLWGKCNNQLDVSDTCLVKTIK